MERASHGEEGSLLVSFDVHGWSLTMDEAKEKQMDCVMKTMNIFSNMSGQEINKDKTCTMFSKDL